MQTDEPCVVIRTAIAADNVGVENLATTLTTIRAAVDWKAFPKVGVIERCETSQSIAEVVEEELRA